MSSDITSRNKSARPIIPPISSALMAFDELPDSAFVPLPVVCALYGCSAATVWRRVRDGHLIAPYRIGMRTTRWSVAELREALASAKGER